MKNEKLEWCLGFASWKLKELEKADPCPERDEDIQMWGDMKGLLEECEDWRESAEGASLERCGEETHCTCVGILRKKLAEYEKDKKETAGGKCYYCSGPINNIAGNPGEWGVKLPHRDEPGKMKVHHVKCVVEQLDDRSKAIALLREVDKWYHHNDDETYDLMAMGKAYKKIRSFLNTLNPGYVGDADKHVKELRSEWLYDTCPHCKHATTAMKMGIRAAYYVCGGCGFRLDKREGE